MIKHFLSAVMAVTVIGCTSYEDGTGSHWTTPTTLVVSGAGNEFTDAQRVTDFVFLQASEKALEYGYRYFVMRSRADTSLTETTTVYTAPTANTAGGFHSYNSHLPGMDAVFEMYEDAPEGFRPGQYWDALLVYHDLGPKYLGDGYEANKTID